MKHMPHLADFGDVMAIDPTFPPLNPGWNAIDPSLCMTE
jgi:hypothetical protein